MGISEGEVRGRDGRRAQVARYIYIFYIYDVFVYIDGHTRVRSDDIIYTGNGRAKGTMRRCSTVR